MRTRATPVGEPRRPALGEWGPDGAALLDELAAAARSQGWRAATRTALRMRSFATREVLTRNATNGSFDYAGVLALVRGPSESWAPPPTAGWDRKWTEALAWVVGLQCLEADDELIGARLFATAHAGFGLDSVTERGRFIYLQLLLRSGERARAAAVLDELRTFPDRLVAYARADLLNPFGVDPTASPAAAAPWLAALNSVLTAVGTEPVRLDEVGPTPFDRLHGEAPAASVSGPLVSVVMSSYRPDEALLTSVRSVLAQTWADLEVVLVDDASGPEFDGVLERCAGLDPRVRLVRQPVNGGTYLARNAGLDLARGEFVTNQDSDDWSFPRRLEHQLAPLLADPAVLATRGTSLRCDERLMFSLPGWDPAWKAVSTLMFRRAFVAEHVGAWDRVRKSADSEFLDRLRLAGERHGGAVVDVEPPLLFARLVEGGLSRSELMFGWEHEARRDYRLMFEHWHRSLRASGASTYLSAAPGPRPFPAPTRFAKGVPGEGPLRAGFDVVLAGDWLKGSATVELTLHQVSELGRAGKAVGLLQLEGFARLERERRLMAEPILDAVATGRADWVHLDQGAATDVLLVQDPKLLIFAPSTQVDLVAAQTLTGPEGAARLGLSGSDNEEPAGVVSRLRGVLRRRG